MMAKMKTTPQAPAPTQVTTAAKRPDKTKKFLADISAALDFLMMRSPLWVTAVLRHTKLLYYPTEMHSPTYGRR